MLVVDDYRLHAFERDVDDVFYFVETFICCSFPSRLFQVKSEIINTPFGTMLSIIFFTVFLDSYVCQMAHHVVQIAKIIRIFLCTESSKSLGGEPDLKWSIASYQDINSEIKLLLPNEERLIDVPRNDIGLLLSLLLKRQLGGLGPLLKLLYLVH